MGNSIKKSKLITNKYNIKLINAIKNDNLFIVKELIEKYNANPKLIIRPSGNKWTLIHLAIISDSYHIINYLVKYGIDINALDNYGYSALHHAAKLNSYKCVKYLVFNNIEINLELKDSKNKYNNLTAYQIAKINNCHDFISELANAIKFKNSSKNRFIDRKDQINEYIKYQNSNDTCSHNINKIFKNVII